MNKGRSFAKFYHRVFCMWIKVPFFPPSQFLPEFRHFALRQVKSHLFHPEARLPLIF